MARRDTRELILQTSLALFNEQGEPNVTTNQIADEADISPGNLHYHFRRKQDIVEELFTRFAEIVVPLFEVPDSGPSDPEALWFRVHLIIEAKGQFRFIYRNLSDISERMPQVDRALRALVSREEKAILGLLLGLESNGALMVTDAQRMMLFEQVLLTFTYWIPFADQFDPDGMASGAAQVRAIARIFLLLVPYLQGDWQSGVESLAADYT